MRKKQKFNDDTFGQYAVKDMEKYGKKYGFTVIADKFQYFVIDRGRGSYYEVHATAFSKKDLEIEIVFREGDAGKWIGVTEVEAQGVGYTTSKIKKDSVESMFKALAKELDYDYTVEEVLKMLRKIFDRVSANYKWKTFECFLSAHKYLGDLAGIADYDGYYDGGYSAIEEFIEGLPKELLEDFYIGYEEKGTYTVSARKNTKVKW
tara:strand:+ start:251 stop:868 length:618 start_codon:yes stop_codon:yes gene_type:complete